MASPAVTQRPSWVMPDGHDVVAVAVDGPSTWKADTQETSCSAERPPNRTTSRIRSASATSEHYDGPMRFSATDLAAATGGVVHGDGTRRSTDRHRLDGAIAAGGELFVPIVAERDGHDFIAGRRRRRRRRVLTQRVPEGVTAIAVADTAAALLDVGRLARRRLGTMVVGITGSVGKTSTKDLLAAGLARRWRTAASERSFNNELGVPSPWPTPEGTQAAVVEMGARGSGHVALLCDVARPTVGVVTAVVHAHTEMFGSIDEVAAAKGELVEASRRRARPCSTPTTPGRGDGRPHAARVLRYSAPARPAPTWSRRGCASTTTCTAVHAAVARGVGRGAPRRPGRAPGGQRPGRGRRRPGVRRRGRRSGGRARRRRAVAVADGPAPGAVGALVLNDSYNANPASMAAACARWRQCRPAGGSRCWG